MLYIIGLGLHINGITQEGLEAVKKSKKVYLENYTVDFPYPVNKISEVMNKKIYQADRQKVESLEIVDEARKKDVALLVYGSPLTATTHISLVEEAIKSEVKYKVIYSSSIIDAVAETGLQVYKFGKITSMPKWKKSYEPDSFLDVVKQNKSIQAHSLILIDIDMEFKEAIKQLEKATKNKNIKISSLMICQSLGTKHKKIVYGKFSDIKNEKIYKPFCFIIPGKLHFNEKQFLEMYE